MSKLKNIAAVLFDMDGTLVDSETLTEPVIVALCSEFGIHDVAIDCSQFFGLSWLEIERRLIAYYPQIAGKPDLPAHLQALFHTLLRDEPPPLIRGSRESLLAASQYLPVAVVSSSGRESVEETIRRMNIADAVSFYAGFEDYQNCKPEPDGYLKAAEELQVEPADCLVFEDSVVGIRSAKNAGMKTIAVTHRCADIETVTELADMTIRDYADLDASFFRRISE